MRNKINELYSKYSGMSREELVNAINGANPEAKLRYEALLKKKQELKSRDEKNETIDSLYEKAKIDKNASDYNFLENYIKNRQQIDNIVKLENNFQKKGESIKKEADKLQEGLNNLNEQRKKLGENNIAKAAEEVKNLEEKLKEKEEQLKNLEDTLKSVKLDDATVYEAAKSSLENEVKSIKDEINLKKQGQYYTIAKNIEQIPAVEKQIEILRYKQEYNKLLTKNLEITWTSLIKGIPMESIKLNDGAKKYKLSSKFKEKIDKTIENEDKVKKLEEQEKNSSSEKTETTEKDHEKFVVPDFLKKFTKNDDEEKKTEIINNDINDQEKDNTSYEDKIIENAEKISKGETEIIPVKKNIFSKLFRGIKDWFTKPWKKINDVDVKANDEINNEKENNTKPEEEKIDSDNNEKIEENKSDIEQSKVQIPEGSLEFRNRIDERRNAQLAFLRQVNKMTKTTEEDKNPTRKSINRHDNDMNR